MPKYQISAKMVSYLVDTIEADSIEAAEEEMEKMLDNGVMTEVDGWIEGKEVEEVEE